MFFFFQVQKSIHCVTIIILVVIIVQILSISSFPLVMVFSVNIASKLIQTSLLTCSELFYSISYNICSLYVVFLVFLVFLNAGRIIEQIMPSELREAGRYLSERERASMESTVVFDFCSSSLLQTCFIVFGTSRFHSKNTPATLF